MNDLSEVCEHDVQGSDREDNGDICGQHVSQVQNGRRPRRASGTDVQYLKKVLDKA